LGAPVKLGGFVVYPLSREVDPSAALKAVAVHVGSIHEPGFSRSQLRGVGKDEARFANRLVDWVSGSAMQAGLEVEHTLPFDGWRVPAEAIRAANGQPLTIELDSPAVREYGVPVH